MSFQFIPYLIPLFISFLILIFLAIYGYRHRSVRGSKAFTASMVIGSLWALANALEMAGTDLWTKLFWANLQYIAYAFAPVAWLIMVLQFTDRADWVNKRNIILMSIVPLITFVLVWTDPLYGLVRYGFSLDNSGVFPVIAKKYGIWFWVHYIYSYLLNFATVIFLFRAILLKNTVYRKQAIHLITGFLLISFCNILYVSGFSPFEGFDVSPISFSIAGLIIAWGIFHFHLFDLVPVARETVIEKMGSGIIVIDKMKRLIDVNPQAESMLGLSNKVMGQQLGDIIPELYKEVKDLLESKVKRGLIQTEISLVHSSESDVFFSNKENRSIDDINNKKGETNNREVERYNIDNEQNSKISYFELYISPLEDKQGEDSAWVLMINDITDLKMAREQINRQQQELAVMDERERMARDLHDNLGQVLSFSTIQIQAVRSELSKSNYQTADKYLKRLSEIVKGAHKDIREYVYNIRDTSCYKKDLISLLLEEIEDFKEHSNIKVEFEVQKDIKSNVLSNMGTEEKLQLIHISREALTNILKYAEADTVQITLKTDTGMEKETGVEYFRGELIIADNGKGIDTEIQNYGGSGINIMNERARLIEGCLKIESVNGKGTKVICSFPLLI
ncbi:MAG: histidine kinase N-terminal 7TM domain-containing protein [Halanaerobiales bacterium]